MTDKRRIEDLSAAELFSLAADKLREEEGDPGLSLTTMELRLEKASRELMAKELLHQLEKPEGKGSKKCPTCGQRTRIRTRNKARTLRTLGGEIQYRRNYHYCEECSSGFYPRDIELRIPSNGELSFEVERRVVDFGINDPDAQAATRFSLHYGSTISSNQVRKALHRTGQRLCNSEPEWVEEYLLPPQEAETGVMVVQADGGMVSTLDGWKEVKLGVIYNAVKPAPKGYSRPNPLPIHSRYVCRLGEQQDFEDALEQAMNAHTPNRVKQVVWVGDGAAGFWNICSRLAPDAVEILDWYHAMEHAGDCTKSLLGLGGFGSLYIDRIKKLLWKGDIVTLLLELEACLFIVEEAEKRESLKRLIRYYQNHSHRMNYAEYRQKHYPIGSGRVESAHKHVIQQRMKRAGQHWSYGRAQVMARLRAAYCTAGANDFYGAIEKAHEKSAAA